ncbi:MAG: methyltransferase domain-containing protein, partial [Plesiomonas shigelloides]
ALPAHSLWDLFCGVGGFGLHCATPDMALTGIEISPEAIACAQKSAATLGLNKVQFQALDSADFAHSRDAVPDLVLVNPPRRGIGVALCEYLSRMAPEYILYSSCNAVSMQADVARLTANSQYQLLQMQLFDMFPHTAHYEVLGLLKKSAG